MPRTHRSGRERVAAAGVRNARRPSGVWPSARRWLVVVGLVSGAWFAGAACAAADEAQPVAGLAETAAAQQDAAGTPAADTAETTDAADVAPEPAAAAADLNGTGGAADLGGAGTSNTSGTAANGGGATDAAVQHGAGEAAPDPVGSATESAAGSGGETPTGTVQHRADRSATAPNATQDGGGSAADPLGDAVAAIGEVGREAGRTMPIHVAAPGAPGAAGAVSNGMAADGTRHLPGFGPVAIDGVATLPDLDAALQGGTDPGADAGANANTAGAARTAGSSIAGAKTAADPGGRSSAQTGSAATADYTGFSGTDGSAASGDQHAAEPQPDGIDRPDAASVGSAVNTSGSGSGMCAGYLPAAASAAPAAGSLQSARKALAEVPKDLSEQPTVCPD
ncbi:hypothetical protein GCM10027570_16820 [Streptomonospora sediminis]